MTIQPTTIPITDVKKPTPSKWDKVASKITLRNVSYGENDEGDYDFYSKFELRYKGQQV